MTTVVLNTVTRKVEVFSSARDVQARAEIADHKAAADPHPQYLADADLADVALSGDAGDLTAGMVPDARMPNWTGYHVASRTALEATNVPAAVDALRLLGYTSIGDGGGALYKRAASEPSHEGKLQSADGAWWELAESPINVLQFGAKASGLNADADTNTTAFDNCIAYLKASGGGTLVVPAGTYYKSTTSIMDASNIHIKGAGRAATKIVLQDSPLTQQGPLFHFGDGTFTTFDCSISAMELDGNLANQLQSTTPGVTNPGLTVQQVDGFNGFDLYVHDCDGYGIGMSGTGHTPRQDVNIRNVEVERTNHDGIDIKGGAQRYFLDDVRVHDTLANPRGSNAIGIDVRGQRVNLSNFWVWNVSNSQSQPGVRVRAEADGLFQDEINLSNGFVFDSPRGFNLSGGDNTRANLTNCWSKGTASYGIHQTQGNFVLHGCHVDTAGTDGIRIETTGKRLVMHGGSVRNSVQDGIRRNGNTHLELHGVDVSNNTRFGAYIFGAGIFKTFGGRIADHVGASSIGLILDGVSDEWILAGTEITGNTLVDIQYTGTVAPGHIFGADYSTVSGSAPDGTFDTTTFNIAAGTFTPTFTFQTPGDLSVSYSIQNGTYTRNGDRVDFDYVIAFTPTYTTASGTALFQGIPSVAAGGSNDRYSFVIGRIVNAVLPDSTFNYIAGRLAGGGSDITILRSRDSGTSTNANTANFPSGTDFVVEISGTYRV